MKCPKCEKAELKEDISFTGVKGKGMCRIYTFFCPLCDYEKKKEIPISIPEFEKCMREIKVEKRQEADTEVHIGEMSVKTKGKKQQ